MLYIYILFELIVVGCLIFVFLSTTFSNYQECVIRINEAEVNIDNVLKKRFDLLNKSIDVIKNITEIDNEILPTIANIRSQKLNNYELDKELYKAIEEFHEYSENNVVLKENDEYTKIEIDLIESESEIVALKKYYNDILVKYNKLISSFPSSIVGHLKHYKQKEEFKLEDHLELINSLK